MCVVHEMCSNGVCLFGVSGFGAKGAFSDPKPVERHLFNQGTKRSARPRMSNPREP